MSYAECDEETKFDWWVSFCAFEASHTDIFQTSSTLDLPVYVDDQNVDLVSWTQSAGGNCTNMDLDTHYEIGAT